VKVVELSDGLVVGICGLRGPVDVDVALKLSREVELSFGVAVQFFDASLVATWEHVYFSVLNAVKAIEAGKSIAKSIGVEILVRLSGQRQISVALEMFGLKGGCRMLGLAVVGRERNMVEKVIHYVVEKLGLEDDDAALDVDRGKAEQIMKAFNIKDEELSAIQAEGESEALAKCCIERCALLALES